ncbi:unnamed protein product [Larinioides sclopetarius]|uniref:Uncharacterized protein n=1 Tax=Larinioides sclopetarius TaxID=280406 RepID=A0AAV2A7A3_9ARAC
MAERREELEEILKGTRMFDDKEYIVQAVSCLSDYSESFLISLIKSDFREIIPFIYESSDVLLKLYAAGFETDPKVKDSGGKSAFFHALKTEESHLVFLLYDHAANACLQAKASIRFPDSEIVKNLKSLKSHLKLLEKDIESTKISQKSRCLFAYLCRFNEFQIEICEHINIICIKYYGRKGKEYEASQRKETILAILKAYETYFNYVNGELEPCLDDIYLFKAYYEHKAYFDKLDFSSAVIFFDNLFLLKEKLILPNTAYLDVESNFSLFIFFRKYLEQFENQKRFYFVSRWITFQERLSLQRDMCRFKEILEGTELSKKNIVRKLPDSAVRTLTNLPEIYGQFLIFRLQNYLNAAAEVTVKDLKSILVIERCLQVVGECFKESDFKSVQRILILGLPTDFIRTLKQIRNRLSNIKSHELQYKYDLEQDKELFQGIQNELEKLKKLLLPVYSFHKYEMDQFLLNHSIRSIRKAQEINNLNEHENQLKDILPSPETEENNFLVQSRWNYYFDDIHTFLTEEIENMNRNGNIIDKNTFNSCKNIVENIISTVEKQLKSLKAKDPQNYIEELHSHFCCLEEILTYITTDQKLNMHNTKLTKISKERQSVFTKLRKNFIESQKRDKAIDRSTEGTPVAKRKTAEMLLSSESGNTCNKTPKIMNPFYCYGKYGSTIETSSFISCNKNTDNGSSLPKLESFKAKQTKDENIRENVQKRAFQTGLDDSNQRITINSKKECKEDVVLCGNSVKLESLIRTAENNPPFADATNVCNDKENSFIEKAETFLNDYKKFANILFQEFQVDPNEDFFFNNIENYCWIFKGHKILNETEKELILQSVPERFQNVLQLKRNVKDLLTEKTEFTKEIEEDLVTLNLNDKEIKKIKENVKSGLTNDAIDIIDSAHDYFLDLKEKIELKEIDKSDYKLLCKKLKIPKYANEILLKVVKLENKKIPCNQFEFLLHRIEILENILIVENNGIAQLWNEATTPRRKMHVKEKIVQLYLNDSAIQASVEMLLFDCMNILDLHDLKHLRRKRTNLLNGIDLRNVLAHGNPLLEFLGRLLDPCDLPSELVEKMLKLISDKYVIDCIQQILEESQIASNDFMEILEDEGLKHLSEPILNCNHFYDYAPLIKMRDNCHYKKVVSP